MNFLKDYVVQVSCIRLKNVFPLYGAAYCWRNLLNREEMKKAHWIFQCAFLYQLTLTISFMKSIIYEANIVFHCE